MLLLRLNASHPIRRHVATIAATKVRLAVITACPTHVGVVFSTYGYTLRQNAAILQHQARPIKSWFHFAQSCKENRTNQLFDPCCT